MCILLDPKGSNLNNNRNIFRLKVLVILFIRFFFRVILYMGISSQTLHNLNMSKSKQILIISHTMLHTFPIPPVQSFLACPKGSIYIPDIRLSLFPTAPDKGSKFSIWINKSDKETNSFLSLSNPVSQWSSPPCETFADIFTAKVCSTIKEFTVEGYS